MNTSLAFYLKYRPQSFDELVGQTQVKKTLQSSFLENRLSHAYLFSGPKGTGKTSTARILAKMVNCEGKGDKVPCNKCDTCKSITDGSNLDLIEIDAASNRGIEDIRTLREKIKLSPTNSKKKVYIIDEVHMLTTEAFNALLKTLEEPPSHALFILATTEQQKLPQTILSRVQKLDFKPSSNAQLKEALQKIIEGEKIKIEDEALNLLIKKAEGSFRDGVKLLDQLSSRGEEITLQLLQQNIQSPKFEIVLDLLKNLAYKDTTASLSLIVGQTEQGLDPKELTLNLMETLRSLVFIKNGLGEELVKQNYSEEDFKILTDLSGQFENSKLVSTLETLQKALESMKNSSIPSLPLELAVVEVTQSVILRAPKATEGSLADASFSNELRDSSPPIATQLLAPQNDKVEITETPIPSDLSGPPSPSDSSDIVKLKEKWTLVLETIRPFNFSLEALLRSINISQCTDKNVFIEVPYSFHQRILEAPKNRDLLESVLSDVLGRNIQIVTVLGTRVQAREDIANIEVAADDEIIRVAAEIFSSDTVN